MPRQEPGEPYRRVNIKEAKQILDEGNAAVVDVRRDDEWLAGHVKGAIHIPIDDLLTRFNELPKRKKLLFICAQGVRSGLGCEMAAAMGVPTQDLFNVEEGTAAWIENKLPASFGKQP